MQPCNNQRWWWFYRIQTHTHKCIIKVKTLEYFFNENLAKNTKIDQPRKRKSIFIVIAFVVIRRRGILYQYDNRFAFYLHTHIYCIHLCTVFHWDIKLIPKKPYKINNIIDIIDIWPKNQLIPDDIIDFWSVKINSYRMISLIFDL